MPIAGRHFVIHSMTNIKCCSSTSPPEFGWRSPSLFHCTVEVCALCCFSCGSHCQTGVFALHVKVLHMIRDLVFPALVLICATFLLSGSLLNHDVSWYLISTRWWLDGTPIYEEILELNPPLTFYLTVPPVWLAKSFDLSPTATFQTYVLILSGVSLVLSQRVLRQDKSVPDWMRIGFLTCGAIALAIVPLKDFGQREHLFVVFLLPYLTLALVDYECPRRQRIIIAIWATFGIAIKHYFVLVPLALALHRMFVEKSFRCVSKAEHSVPVILMVAYVVAARLLHPAYFNDVIPLAMQVYGGYESEVWAVLRKLTVLPVFFGLIVLMVLGNHGGTRASWALIAVVCAAFAIYVLQSKGWSYHRVPLVAGLFLALNWATFELARSQARKRVFGLIGLIAAILLINPILLFGTYRNGSTAYVADYFTCPDGQRTVQVFSARVIHGFPLANYAKAQPSNRAPALWLFPGAAHQLSLTSDPESRAKYKETLDFARSLAISDFFRTNPQLVVVDTRKDKRYFKGTPFDYIEFFSQIPKFADAWQDYERVGQVGGLTVYRRPGCDTPAL
ncbi:hypothetical protein HW561_21135 [Rhodobacteraceae bacterium B1Z28]|uniref:Glycosyltransferase RgtA/B/C/D-like domain-containing protein n=1 Tax=Ruegeria haliotis TaxID=2747601 RepID=A0ABX2PW82_9RHOB|nr:hypothetical protein [Ruegeria haliotis]NVO58293.1 hypothetical protein [Ruegeria haliotis]